MALITFMSDFGMNDHYVAAVKGKILSKKPSQCIVDITHFITPYDIAHGSIVLKSVFKEFPRWTVHLASIDTLREQPIGIALELDSHFFVGFDCGLFSLISDKKPLNKVKIPLHQSTFPTRDVLATVAIRLANGESLRNIGTFSNDMVELLARQLKVTKREIVGNVVNVDHYGNLITNIVKHEFDNIRELNGAGVCYIIQLGREVFEQLHTHFTDVDSGDCFLFFNSLGYLQIGINKGNAAQLLGLGVDAPVHIEFQVK